MHSFNFFTPTQIRFGVGRIKEVGDVISGYGKKCLMVTSANLEPLDKIHNRVKDILNSTNIEVFHFDGVIPNPTINSIEEGLEVALKNNIDCVLGLGGGSAMDTAKLIAFLFSNGKNPDWDSIFKVYSNPFGFHNLSHNCLPLITITTTSGTGSHVTQAAVVTDTRTNDKLTIFHQDIFPKISIVDPELMLSMPIGGTAATGFDVFAHAFESYLGDRTSPLTELMSLEAIKIVADYLPKLMHNPLDINFRTKLAWADTLAGMCLANGGADIPHPLSEIIGGICPRIAHGQCLALVYPEFLRYKKDKATSKFANVARKISSKFLEISDDETAEQFCEGMDQFLKKINLWASLKDYGVTELEYTKIIDNHSLSHLPFAPEDDLKQILITSYNRV